MPNHLIVVEGLDGSGKTTMAKALVDALNEYHKREAALYLKFPDYTSTTGLLIRSYLRGGWNTAGPEIKEDNRKSSEGTLFQVLQFANRFEQLSSQLAGKSTDIVADRFSMSGFVYGALDGADLELSKKMAQWLPPTDYTIYVDTPLEIILARLDKRKSEGAAMEIYESEQLLRRTQELYEQEIHRPSISYGKIVRLSGCDNQEKTAHALREFVARIYEKSP